MRPVNPVMFFGCIMICTAFTYLYTKSALRCNENKSHFRPLNFAQNGNNKLDYEEEMEKLIKAKVDQHDQRLIQLIRDFYIIPPSVEPYNLRKPNATDYSNGKASTSIDNSLNFKESGFYVECGGFDGETGSNTLFFEKTRHWNGILIEADPHNYIVMKTKHRRAFLLNACLNTEPHPAKKTFTMGIQRGRVSETKEQKQYIREERLRVGPIKVLCLPLYSILRAMGQLNVDFFSLDIQGDEIPVLKTIPWNMVNITTLSVEYKGKVGHNRTVSYLKNQGYNFLRTVNLDVLFKKNI